MSLPFSPQPKPMRRLEAVTASRRVAQLAWQQCCRVVDARDQHRCRVCRCRVRRTMEVCPERLEHHHLIARRVEPGLRTDVRAVICVCLSCHGRLTRHELTVHGNRFFTHQGRICLDAEGELSFVEA